MAALNDFGGVAAYLDHPLVLIGFLLMLFFGIHKALIRAEIIPKLSPESGSKVVYLLLRYGFIIAVLVILFGFALEAFKVQNTTTKVEGKIDALTAEVHEVLAHATQGPAASFFIGSVNRAADYEQAQSLIQDATNILDQAGADTGPEDYYQLGNIFAMLGDLEHAEASYLAATEADAYFGDAWLGLGLIYQLKANDMIHSENFGLAQAALYKGERYVKIAMDYNADDPDVHAQLGYMYKERANRYALTPGLSTNADVDKYSAKAATHFNMAIAVDENNASAHNGLASVFILQKKWGDAIQESKKAIELEPSYLFAHYDLAMAYYGIGRASYDPTEFCDARRGFKDAESSVVALLDPEQPVGPLTEAHRKILLDYLKWFNHFAPAAGCDGEATESESAIADDRSGDRPLVYLVYFDKTRKGLAEELARRFMESGFRITVSSSEELPPQLQKKGVVPSGILMTSHLSVPAAKISEANMVVDESIEDSDITIYDFGTIPLADGNGWQTEENELLIVFNE